MTRKRFVKLLMSKGYSRNMANAKAAIRPYCSYCEYYNSTAIQVEILCNSISRSLARTFGSLDCAAKNASNAFTDFATATPNPHIWEVEKDEA